MRILVGEVAGKVGESVELCGWIEKRRDHGKLIFVDLRDRSGVVQVVGDSSFSDVRPLDAVSVTGIVKERPKGAENQSVPTGFVEVEARELKILAKAQTPPFDMGGPELNLELPTLLDYRPLTLRHPKIAAIFKVQETIIDSFRKICKDLDFTEFQAPTIVPVTTEGGAQVFPIDYYGHNAYLGQSPQLYKQMMVPVYERVFSVGRAYRAEPSTTTRHLSEYVTLDLEFGFIKDWTEILDVAENVIKFVFQSVEEKNRDELMLYNATVPKTSDRLPRIKLRDAQGIIEKRTGRKVIHEPDLSPEDEREICKWAEEEHGSELVIVTHYPTKKRPFYTFPDPDDPDYTYSFDLLGRGVEWFTGGQRINDYEKLLTNIKDRGLNPKDFELYLQAFKYGMPPEGGFAIGAERVTMHILGLSNIREASLFPRDMERVDVRLSTIEKKEYGKKKIKK